MAIMDTVIPSIRRETVSAGRKDQLVISEIEYTTTVNQIEKTVANPPDSESLDAYFDERPSDIPLFQDLLKRTLSFYVCDDVRKGLGFVLSTLK